MIDLSNLTLGEVSTIEELSGRSITELEDTKQPMGKLLAALAMVIKRRSGEPKFTWNAALALTIPEANDIIGLNDDEEDEEEAGKENSVKPEQKKKHSS